MNARLLVGSLATIGTVSLFGGAVYAAVDNSPRPAVSQAVDISGNCDEAEHANDPACIGAAVTPTTVAGTSTTVPQPVPTSIPATTSTVPGGLDISGNCDEAEHANDPGCLGVNPVPTTVPGGGSVTTVPTGSSTTVPGGEDISGNCDEAEHANDPECQPATTAAPGSTPAPAPVDNDRGCENDDNSGHGHCGDDESSDDDDDDNSGSGSSGSDDDDDDDDDDNDSDDDNSDEFSDD